MKKFVKTKLIYLIPPLAAAAILFTVLAFKDMAPFGNQGMVLYDLLHGTYPGYVYTYDALHGAKSLFYDFTTAGGFERPLLFALTDTANVFLYFFPRESLFDAFTYLYAAKFSLIAYTSFLAFRKLFPALKTEHMLLFSLLYTFSTYSLQYYSNILWLDAVALFPLTVLAAWYMFKGKSKVPFIALFSFLIISNTYFAFFFFLIFIVFGGLYIFVFTEKPKRKGMCFSLGISAATALFITAYPLYEYVKSIFASSRLSNTIESAEQTGFISGMLNTGTAILVNKAIMLIGTEFCFACLLFLLIRFKKEKRACLFFGAGTMLILLQCAFIGIDLLWHGGSYTAFPFRMGFIISFFMLSTAAYYMSKYSNEPVIKSNSFAVKVAVLTLLALSTIITAAFWTAAYNTLNTFDLVNAGVTSNLLNKAYIVPVLSVIACAIVTSVILILIPSVRLRRIATAVFLAACVCFQAITFIQIGAAKSTTYISHAEKLYSEDNETDYFTRIVNPDSSLGSNYGYIADIPTITNWTHTLGNEQKKIFSDLGFSLYFTSTLDGGGTVFSQALLNITKAENVLELPDELYQKTSVDGNYTLYDCVYTLPVGMVFNGDLSDISADSSENRFEYQNEIYRSLTGRNDSLFKKETLAWNEGGKGSVQTDSITTLEADNYFTEINCDGKRVYYFYSDDEDNILDLFTANGRSSFFSTPGINGEPLKLDYFGEISYLYKYTLTNNIVCLGVFEDETFTFDLSLVRGSTDTVVVYSAELSKLEELCGNTTGSEYSCEKNSFSFNSVAENDGDILFIPLTYCENFVFTDNGEPIEAEKVLGSFIGIKLTKGENVIEMHYNKLPAAAPLIYVVLASLITAAVFLFVKKKHITAPPSLERAALWAFGILSAGAVAFLYVLPVVTTLIYEFTH